MGPASWCSDPLSLHASASRPLPLPSLQLLQGEPNSYFQKSDLKTSYAGSGSGGGRGPEIAGRGQDCGGPEGRAGGGGCLRAQQRQTEGEGRA